MIKDLGDYSRSRTAALAVVTGMQRRRGVPINGRREPLLDLSINDDRVDTH